MPTALARPCPSGPVVVSTPGAMPCSGWPGVFEWSWRKRFELLHRQIEAAQVQQRVQQHGAVPVGEHEAVAVGPGRIGRVEAQVVVPQHFGDLGHAHRHSRMTRVRLLNSIHGQRTQRVGEFLSGCHRGSSQMKVQMRTARFRPVEIGTARSSLYGKWHSRQRAGRACAGCQSPYRSHGGTRLASLLLPASAGTSVARRPYGSRRESLTPSCLSLRYRCVRSRPTRSATLLMFAPSRAM